MVRQLFILSAGILLFPFVFLFYILVGRKKKLWIFGSWRGQKYSDNSKVLFEYVLQNEKDIKAVWITKNKTVYHELKSKQFPVVMNHSPKAIYYMLRAGFSTGSLSATTDTFGSKWFLAYKITSLYLTHGMPSKYAGYDEPRLAHKKKLITENKSIGLKLYFSVFPQKDPRNLYSVSTSDFFVPFLESALLIPSNRIFVTGTPRLDTLFSTKKNDYITDIRKKFPTAKIIIYMPTFRASFDGGPSFKPFGQFGFNAEKFIRILEKHDYVFLNKGHFWDGQLSEQEFSERFINVIDNPLLDVYDLIKDTDILMTDYSSIYFDFLPLLKPAILTPFDFDSYTQNYRGQYYDYRQELPSIKAFNWNEVCDILQQKSYFPLTEAQTLKYHKYIDGNSSARLTKEIRKILSI